MMFTFIKTLLQYIVPQHLLSRFIGKIIQWNYPPIKNAAITHFIKRYNVNMQEAEQEDPLQYKNFNAFFTRSLKPGARLIATNEKHIVSPADGVISQMGEIKADRIFQAKGFDFTVDALLGGSHHMAEKFEGGQFATVYLSPKDYHRVHMPVAGTLTEMIYVPGRLFSVNQLTVSKVPNLFARNERVVCLFETALGPMALVLVGAMIVASIHTAWAGQIAPSRERDVNYWHYNDQQHPPVSLKKGEEMGHFQLGSTAIMLFAKDVLRWNDDLTSGSAVQMGQAMAETL